MTETCRYPRCKDHDGNPRTTNDGMCNPHCQDRLRNDIQLIVLEWVRLHTILPKPIATEQARRAFISEHGHSAEWASDTAAHIAGLLNDIHDNLAEALNTTPPPHPGTSETVRVRAAWKYLETRISELAQQEWSGDTAQEVRQLRHRVRKSLGRTIPRIALPMPCPNDECGLRTLIREIRPGRDYIECGNCGYMVKETYYPLLVRMALDTIISNA